MARNLVQLADREMPYNQRAKSGKPTAYTMGQRYVSSQQLLTAKLTSDLS
ncbi:hypothetical protein [Aureliella helgolandensis]|uniref:Uncharacterized protein n=1 Tax=Aureliella helgolandensis TaxID=2527968 RepID=A0A518GBH2_9BACT|nr:hypothetical protein [Aureliella helgolandensis]QDV25966.1 hypothetical protein Q31a_43360 [Aureliella helgolandensis]